jgi:hypothetical protein
MAGAGTDALLYSSVVCRSWLDAHSFRVAQPNFRRSETQADEGSYSTSVIALRRSVDDICLWVLGPIKSRDNGTVHSIPMKPS